MSGAGRKRGCASDPIGRASISKSWAIERPAPIGDRAWLDILYQT